MLKESESLPDWVDIEVVDTEIHRENSPQIIHAEVMINMMEIIRQKTHQGKE